jgi:hypothetical protein
LMKKASTTKRFSRIALRLVTLCLAFSQQVPAVDPSADDSALAAQPDAMIRSEHGAEVTIFLRGESHGRLSYKQPPQATAGGMPIVMLRNLNTNEVYSNYLPFLPEAKPLALEDAPPSLVGGIVYSARDTKVLDVPAGEFALTIRGGYFEIGVPKHPSGGDVYYDVEVFWYTLANYQVRLNDGLPPAAAPTPGGEPAPTPPPIPVDSTSINALVITSLTNPMGAIEGNTRLRGGVVALGIDSAASPTSPASTARITPDRDLLTGNRIPPITPNLIDFRISRHSVTAEIEAAAASE